MANGGPGLWKAADATKRINECARRGDLTLNMTKHARDQMIARGLLMGDLKHVLKKGFVYDEAVPATRTGFFRYAVEGTTPNSEGRTVRTVVIPDGEKELKIVTFMWRDEQ